MQATSINKASSAPEVPRPLDLLPLALSSSFWKGKRVFITGHTGFKGSWLSLWLSELGASVSGLALEPTTPSFFDLTNLSERVSSHLGDIRDAALVDKILQAEEPEIVFHLAAQPLVRLSYREPLSTWATNVMGTAHVLEAVRSCPSVRSVVVVTSDKCYLNQERLWGYREDEHLGGHDPYSASKGATELVAASYRKSFFSEISKGSGAQSPVMLATARAGNVIGGGDFADDRLLPDAARAALRGKALTIRSPQAIRPWQFVLEPLLGYMQLACALNGAAGDPLPFAEAWNFGPRGEDEATVAEVLSLWNSTWSSSLNIEVEDGPKVHEASILRLDSSKARHRLGWDATLSLHQAIAETVRWYKAWAKKYDAVQEQGDLLALSIAQISSFSKCAALQHSRRNDRLALTPLDVSSSEAQATLEQRRA